MSGGGVILSAIKKPDACMQSLKSAFAWNALPIALATCAATTNRTEPAAATLFPPCLAIIEHRALVGMKSAADTLGPAVQVWGAQPAMITATEPRTIGPE